MAPRLALSKIEFISDMLKSNELTISQIANAAGCSKRSVYSIRSNLELFGSAKAPRIRAGRPRILTPLMLEALCDHLLIKPTLYLGELADILLDEFGIDVPDYNISRALASLSLQLDGRKRQLSKGLKNEIRICEINMSMRFLSSIPIS